MNRGRKNVELAVAIVRDGRPQFVVAAAAGLHPTKLSAVVNGRTVPNAGERERIAAALNLDEDSIFEEQMVLT